MAWIATVFGAIYVGLLAFILHVAAMAPPVSDTAPLAALGAERGWILLLVLGVWSITTRAPSSSAARSGGTSS